MSVKDDLIAAKAVINTPEKWCKGSYHNGGRGDAHCILGSVRVVVPWWETPRLHAAYEALEAARPERHSKTTLDQFNDHKVRKHADIMALFDRAIELAK